MTGSSSHAASRMTARITPSSSTIAPSSLSATAPAPASSAAGAGFRPALPSVQHPATA